MFGQGFNPLASKKLALYNNGLVTQHPIDVNRLSLAKLVSKLDARNSCSVRNYPASSVELPASIRASKPLNELRNRQANRFIMFN